MNCVPIDMLPTQCPLLPTPWAGEIRWSLLHFRTFIHGFALRTDECDIIYVCKYIQFKFTSRTLQCTMNGIRSLRTGIMEEYRVMSTSQGTCVRIEQTSEVIRVTYEMCRAVGREDWNWEPLVQSNVTRFHSTLFRAAVLNSSPRAPPLCTFRMLLLSLQTFVLFERKCPAKWTSHDIPPWFQFEANVFHS